MDVIIPTFNRARIIGKAIRSVLQQSAALCCRVYVVDDGSSDNTAEVVARLGSRVHYLHQQRAGPAAARNTGIRATDCEFIAFLDSDDVWLPDKVERQLAAMHRWPDVLFVAGRSYDQSGGTQRIRPSAPVPADEPADFAAALFDDNFLPTPVVMVRRAALQRCGLFAPELPQAEDYHLWTRLACRGRGVYLSTPLAVITTDDPGSLTRDRAGLLQASLSARRLLRRELVRRPDCRASWRHGMAHCLAQLRDLCYRRGDFPSAARYGTASLMYRPWPRPRWEVGRVLAAAGRAAWGLITSAAH